MVTTISFSGKDYIPDLHKNLASKFWTNQGSCFCLPPSQVPEATHAGTSGAQNPPFLMADVGTANTKFVFLTFIYLCLIYPDTMSVKYIFSVWAFRFEIPSVWAQFIKCCSTPLSPSIIRKQSKLTVRLGRHLLHM